jgi:lipoprotein-anchoring transpeptidase ErfK/SrfK
MRYRFTRSILILSALLVAGSITSCKKADKEIQHDSAIQKENKPILEATPLKQSNGSWMVAASETLKFKITAPEANAVELLYRPASGSEDYFILKKISAPDHFNPGIFSTEVKLPPDFSGEVWAKATYADGGVIESTPMALASGSTDIAQATQNSMEFPISSNETISTPDEESARSDKFTRGKIEKATLGKGQPNLAITVNVPAFLLTLWQNGKEVKTYDVGVGRKNFPIVVGERQVTEIIFNPDWIPPDSEWVHKAKGVEPFERIEADDPRNPLGSVKIPLGDAYLIHQAAKPSDIGSLVSHGCLRMRKDDLFDLAEKIISARNLPLSKREIEKLKGNKERHVVKLSLPLPVDINYDPQVIEEGVLHIYPDVYDRQTSGVETLRADLQQSGVEASQLDDQTLQTMLKRANPKEEFAVSILDIQAGNALIAGERRPLTEASHSSKPTDQAKHKKKR